MIQDQKDSLIQNLKDAGCTKKDIEEYLCLHDSQEITKQVCLLKKHRCALLEELHSVQKEIDCLDYLLYNIKKNCDCYK